MLRAAAAALSALALAGCHDEDEVSIFNAGSEAVVADIDWDEGDYYYDGHHRFVEIPPGAIYKDDFGHVRDMDIVIFRKSDGLILFAAGFDGDDFDDDHGHIEITVVP